MKTSYALFLCVVMSFPVAYLCIRAFQMNSGSLALFDKTLFFTLISSLFLVVGVIVGAVLLAIPSVILVEKTDLPLRKFWNFLFIIPIAIPSFVGSFTLILAFGPSGSLICQLFHWDHFVSIYGWFGATLSISLFTFSYVFLSAQVLLRSLHPSLDESALLLGLAKHSLFFRLWIPLLKKPILSGIFVVSLYTISDFGTPMLMHYKCLTREIYLAYSGYFDRNYAAFLSFILIFLSLSILLWERRFFHFFSLKKSSKLMECRPYRISLGILKIPALLWCVLVSFLSVFLPLSVLIYSGFSHIDQVSILPLLSKTLQTFCVALASATLISLLIYPLAYWRERGSRSWETLSFAVYLGAALPGIALALGISFFFKTFPLLYQSYAVLFFAYFILFASRSFLILRAGVAEVSQSLEEVAQTLGMSLLQTFRKVTFPLTRRAFKVSIFLVCVSVMKELPVTLLLAPLSYRSLVENIWTTVEEAFFAEASLSCLLLIASAGILFMCLYFFQRGKYEKLS